MKTAIPWILVVALLAGVYFVYAAGKQKDAELARLQQENLEIPALRVENEELKKAAAQTNELARLRKDNEDLLRVRSEVSQLRDQNMQLTRQLQSAQAQRTQAQQQQQQLAQQAQQAQAQAQVAAQAQATAQAHTAACINNLRQIAGVKQTWALEHQKPQGAIPILSDLLPYFPNNTLPVCPGGGTYSINPLVSPPTCTIQGHVLPRQ